MNPLISRDPKEDEEWAKMNKEHNYDISARGYFNRSYNLYPLAAADRNILFYCALELRCAIEKALFEYLSVIRNDALSKQESSLWSAETLKAAILKIEPHFSKKLEFLNLVLLARDIPTQFPVPDLDKMSKDYGLLNSYLHGQKKKSTIRHARWWIRFRELIERIHIYAWPYCANPRIKVDLNTGALPLFKSYLDGIKSTEQVIASLKPWPEDIEIKTNYRNYI